MGIVYIYYTPFLMLAYYIRTTLVDSELNKLLKDNNFIVWGGDVRDYEASQGMSSVQ